MNINDLFFHMEQSEVAIVELHFDGDIAPDHQVSLRTLSKSLGHLQSALDRAYLDIRHGNLWKYAKMHHDYYKDVELLVQPPREGANKRGNSSRLTQSFHFFMFEPI
ncbi:hypothetical protein POX51_25650, partial [Escherichia coli]